MAACGHVAAQQTWSRPDQCECRRLPTCTIQTVIPWPQIDAASEVMEHTRALGCAWRHLHAHQMGLDVEWSCLFVSQLNNELTEVLALK